MAEFSATIAIHLDKDSVEALSKVKRLLDTTNTSKAVQFAIKNFAAQLEATQNPTIVPVVYPTKPE